VAAYVLHLDQELSLRRSQQRGPVEAARVVPQPGGLDELGHEVEQLLGLERGDRWLLLGERLARDWPQPERFALGRDEFGNLPWLAKIEQRVAHGQVEEVVGRGVEQHGGPAGPVQPHADFYGGAIV